MTGRRLAARAAAMVDELEALVTCESSSADPAGIAASAQLLADLGHQLLGEPAEVHDGGHVVWRLGAAPPRVVIVGHHDTVWPSGTLARIPFSVDDGIARGPGVFDMKSGIVIAMEAVAALADRDGVAIVWTSDEEIGSAGGRPLIEDLARHAEAVLVCEPAGPGGALKIARKGVGTYAVVVHGEASHAGLEPEKGVNATVALAELVPQVVALGQPGIGTTVTPTVARAGTAENVVPARAELLVDVRVVDPAETDRVDAGMRALRTTLPGATIEVRGGVNRPPMPASAAEGLYARLVTVAGRLGVEAPEGIAVGGGSDGNFTAALGIPTLDGLGGVGGGAHAESEHVEVSSLPERAALLAGLVEDLIRR